MPEPPEAGRDKEGYFPAAVLRLTDFLPPLGVLLREYGLCTGDPWPSFVMLSKVAESVGSRRALVGTPCHSSRCPQTSSLPLSFPRPWRGSALTHTTRTSQSNFMSSLRFSPGRALEGSRIWTGMPGSLPTSLCPQTPTTLGLAPHCQMIQPRSWEELQVGVDP